LADWTLIQRLFEMAQQFFQHYQEDSNFMAF